MINRLLSKSFIFKNFLSLIFLFFVSTAFSQIPTSQDCLGAIPICAESYSESSSPAGEGNYENEIFGSGQGGICCMDVEKNSVWYTFTVNNTGSFGFTLVPNDSNDDYDWALFNITNASCADIFNDISLQVSCNAAGGGSCDGDTGANGLSNSNNQGGGCFNGNSPFNDLVPVQAGNTYVLLVSNWTGSTNGYTIDFGLSSNIGILDESIPEVAEMILPDNCDSEFQVTFSENIQCNTISDANFIVNGPGGPYSAILTSTVCDAGGEYDKTFDVFINPPILEPGNFVIEMLNDNADQILDLCDNPALPESFDFQITEVALASLDIGNDTILCQGGSVTFDATIPFGQSYLWQDGSTGSSFTVTTPGSYNVFVSNSCNQLYDEVFVDFVSLQPVDVELGEDTILCPGELLQLDATWSNGIDYVWQDGFSGPFYTVSESGYYEVMIEGACGEMGSVGINVDYDPTEISVDLGLDTLLCEEKNETLFLDATDMNADTYEWSTGSDFPYITVEEEGIYAVTLTDDCNVVTDSIFVNYTNCTICEVFIPNGFTPDFNGFNDFFQAYSNCEVDDYNMKIFNRWGALVFESNNIDNGWNGTFNGRDVDEGVYIYFIEYRVSQMEQILKKKFSGDITVVK